MCKRTAACRKISHALGHAAQRAKKRGIEFSLTAWNIPKIPEFCPVLLIRLKVSDGDIHPASPSLDRIDPRGGYTPDNIRWVSFKANTIKSNASAAELLLVAVDSLTLEGLMDRDMPDAILKIQEAAKASLESEAGKRNVVAET
jgi:hydroxypyruvate isomerase